MVLKVETSAASDQAMKEKIAAAIRDVTKLRGDVELLQVGSLPNDGKVIEDARSYQ
jgi:phenylacetate-CoA ligase